MKNVRLAFAALAAVLAAYAPAQDSEEARRDAVVERALRASIVGDAAAIRVLAREELARTPSPVPSIAENLALLALSTEAPLPTLAETDTALDDFASDDATDQYDRLLRLAEPRQRFLEARADRRYESFRRAYNAVVTPIATAFMGQFFDLLSLPITGLEEAFIGRRYLNPEERRELFTARRAREVPNAKDRTAATAAEVLESLTPKRTNLAALHARRSAERAAREQRNRTALWWYDRELLLLEQKVPFRSEHIELRARQDDERRIREANVTVRRGEALLQEGAEFASYGALLRSFVLAPAGADFAERALQFKVDHPYSAAIPAIEGAEAAQARLRGENALARASLLLLAGGEHADSPWGVKARALAADAAFDPERRFREARSAARSRFWNFIVFNDVPLPPGAGIAPEDARLEESSWISALRSLFVFDMVSRLMISPFIDPFPRDEYYAAAAQAPREWLLSSEGRGWYKDTADAMAKRRRHMQARAIYEQLGEADRAIAMEREAARRLFRDAEAETDPARRAAMLARYETAWPAGRDIAQATTMRARAEREALAFYRIPKDVLRQLPELWDGGPLSLPAELLDRDNANGELSDEGVWLLRGGGILYIDRDSEEPIELPVSEENVRLAAERVAPLLRNRYAAEEAAKPLPRRRIPIAIEGSAGPGFDVMPGLVPLSPDPAVRRLYE